VKLGLLESRSILRWDGVVMARLSLLELEEKVRPEPEL
jgi:hypothetical protein